MRSRKVRFVVKYALLVSSSILLCAGALFAQAAGTIPWATYHHDVQRVGQNSNAINLANPNDLNLVWIFPRALDSASSDSAGVVDDSSFATLLTPPWLCDSTQIASSESKSVNLCFALAQSNQSVDTTGNLLPDVRVTWPFSLTSPTDCPRGQLYQVYVWLPAEYDTADKFIGAPYGSANPAVPQATTKAIYYINDINGTTSVTFNQTSTGGGWRLLTTQSFTLDATSSVQLSYLTGDSPDYIAQEADSSGNPATRIMVVADAVKFVPSQGQVIYSSPASATIDYQFTDTAGNLHDLPNTPVVYVGTIDSTPVTGNAPPQWGSIHCVNSATPTTLQAHMADSTAGWADNPATAWYADLSNKLGTDLWEYPNVNPAARQPYEGPVVSGFYASPTVVNATVNGNALTMCIAAGMDGQIYAFNALNGNLLWKGPGITLGEDSAGLQTAGWQEIANRVDAFGGNFNAVQCNIAGDHISTWNFVQVNSAGGTNTPLRNLDGEVPVQGSGAAGTANWQGWSYSVYAWIPNYIPGEFIDSNGNNQCVVDTAGDEGYYPRSQMATYTINYQTAPDSVASDRIMIDQSDSSNWGRWVKLGSSYFDVMNVQLSNSDSTGNPSYVAADAVMIMPDTMAAFGYCTPVVSNTSDSTVSDPGVFALNYAGRVLKFEMQTNSLFNSTAYPFAAPPGQVDWIYPDIRHVFQVTGSQVADQPTWARWVRHRHIMMQTAASFLLPAMTAG